MTAIMNTLLAFISQHTELAYIVIFLVSFSESLAIVGLLVPGTMIMFGVGAIVATGSLKLMPVLLLAIFGAIAGDGASYWLGYHYKDRLVTIWPFARYPTMLEMGKIFFHRHGGKSVLFGRFMGPVRPVIPVVAGMLGMRPGYFTIVNILSAIGWALIHILPGVFLGASLALAGAVSARLAVFVAIFLAGVWVVIWISRKLYLVIAKKGPGMLAALKQWTMKKVPAQGTISGFIKRFFATLIFNRQGEEVLVLCMMIVLLAAGWGFADLWRDVLTRDPIVITNQAIFNFLQSLRTVWVDNIFVAVTELGDFFVNVALFGVVLLVLLAKRCYRASIFWFLAGAGGFLIVRLCKWIFHLPRPIPVYDGISAYGFPSVHAAMSVILYGFLAIIIVRQIAFRWRWGLVSAVVLIAFLIGFSRLYLGIHWFSDVLGGFSAGIVWVSLVGIFYLKRGSDTVPVKLLCGVMLGTCLVAGGWHIGRQHEKDLSFYAPQHKVQTVSLSSWFAGGWRALPANRIDLEGEKEQPLIIQWAGTADEITRYLLSQNWQLPSSLNLADLLSLLSPETSIEKLPVLPRLNNGLTDVVRLVQPIDKQHRWVLRLWPAQTKIKESDTPLFEGTIELQDWRYVARMFYFATDSSKYDMPLHQFQAIFDKRFHTKLVYRKAGNIVLEDEGRRVNWDGGILLISNDGTRAESSIKR